MQHTLYDFCFFVLCDLFWKTSKLYWPSSCFAGLRRQLCVVSGDKNKVEKYSSVGLDGTMVIWDFKVSVLQSWYCVFHRAHWLFSCNYIDISAYGLKYIKYCVKIAFSCRNRFNIYSKKVEWLNKITKKQKKLTSISAYILCVYIHHYL